MLRIASWVLLTSLFAIFSLSQLHAATPTSAQTTATAVRPTATRSAMPMLLASLHISPLIWQRLSPTPQQPEGPVLYQIIFRSSAKPGNLPEISPTFTLQNSPISDNGATLTFGEVVNFAPGQTFPGASAITGVTAGTGLTGGGNSGTVTVGIANGGVGTTQITSGAAPNGTVLTANGAGGVTFAPLPAAAAWSLTGNAGTGCFASPCLEFLGTTDNDSIEVRVDNQRAFRIEPAMNGSGLGFSPNVIGGFSGNAVTGAGSAGAVIAGGGASGNANVVSGSFAVVSGGLRNTASMDEAFVAGGFDNSATGFSAAVGGGRQNTAGGAEGTVAGGFGNSAAGPEGTVGGGSGNTANGQQATVAGGGTNTASGLAATVAGGLNNIASGDFSFAAGSSADANGHRGAFVWGDASTGGPIQATADNQFVARAIGGFQFVSGILPGGLPDPTKTISIAPSSGNVSIPGSLSVSGSITAGVKDFKVDDPIAPREKYLIHASIESSEMMNLYSGNAVLDRMGKALVRLPAWMQAENGDFRYQLTCIGGFAPVYIAQEIRNNQFKIAGGRAGMKVSWLISGVRQDAWAKAHPMRVEEDKVPSAAERIRNP